MPLDEKDKEEIKAMLGEAVKPFTTTLQTLSTAQADLGKNQGVLADTLKNLPPAGEAGKTGKDAAAGELKSLTLEELTKVLDARDQKRQESAAQQTERQRFIEQNLPKLPDAYKHAIGSDPTKWAAEAAQIQKQFETDFVGLGGKPETIGGITRDGGDAANKTPVDHSKMPAFERLHLGLPPVPSTSTAPAETNAAK